MFIFTLLVTRVDQIVRNKTDKMALNDFYNLWRLLVCIIIHFCSVFKELVDSECFNSHFLTKLIFQKCSESINSPSYLVKIDFPASFLLQHGQRPERIFLFFFQKWSELINFLSNDLAIVLFMMNHSNITKMPFWMCILCWTARN